MTDSHLVVDGSNIATEGRTVPSLAQLDEAVRAFTAEFHYDNVIVVVDATFAHRIDPTERQMYEDAVTAGEILTPPAGAIGRGDAFVLEIADRSGGSVLSNDSFQEFHADHEWLFEEGRLWGGKPVPGVGWVFVTRLPVRGPVSHRSRASTAKKHKTSSASTRTTKAASESASKSTRATKSEAKATTGTRARSAAGRATRTPTKSVKARTEPVSDSVPSTSGPSKDQAAPTDRSDGRRGPVRKRDVVNTPGVFLDFVTRRQPGDEVVGEVIEFASHGAYVAVDEARCYLSLKSMGDPAPRSPRDVLQLGEVRSFIVQGFDTPHRGIDLALPDPVASGVNLAESAARADRSRSDDAVPEADQDNFLTPESPEEAQVAATTKKATTKKATVKKAPAKATAKKTAAKKTPTKKTPTKATAKKTTAKTPAKKTPAKATAKKVATKTPAKKTPAKATAKKTPAKKTPAKKTPAKTTAKKTPAKATAKTTAKKAPTKKTPAKKTPAKKTPAKTTAKKAPAKATAKKTATKKAPAKKTPTKKTPAKTTAKKAPAKATAKKTATKKTPAKKTSAKKTPAKKK